MKSVRSFRRVDLPRLLIWRRSQEPGHTHLLALCRSAEESLRRTTDLLRQAETIAGAGGWEIDLEAQSLYWTEQTYLIHDLEPGAYAPTIETAIQFYAPEWRPVITLAVQEAIRTGRGFDLELALITAKGRRIWVPATGP